MKKPISIPQMKVAEINGMTQHATWAQSARQQWKRCYRMERTIRQWKAFEYLPSMWGKFDMDGCPRIEFAAPKPTLPMQELATIVVEGWWMPEDKLAKRAGTVLAALESSRMEDPFAEAHALFGTAQTAADLLRSVWGK